MWTLHTVGGGFMSASLFVIALHLQACAGAWLHVRQVPEYGYEQTLNYQFQAQIHADDQGQCKKMVVRVRALNKLYSGGEPPPRLQLYDDDCLKPPRFERVHYISRETGAQVRLSGYEVTRFWQEHFRLEDELLGWLWRQGII